MSTEYKASTSNKFFPRVRGNLTERFWSKVMTEPNTGCWLWCGDDNGKYGSIGVRGGKQQRISAHRLSYEMHIGAIPADYEIDHICRVGLCVNPQHLRAVTHLENIRLKPDAGTSDLTMSDVAFIRGSNLPQSVLAKSFGVGRFTVARIKRGEFKSP